MTGFIQMLIISITFTSNNMAIWPLALIFLQVTPAALASTLMSGYPEVSHATTLANYQTLIEADGEYYVENVVFADEEFFNVFGHVFLKGDASTALSNAKGAVLTESFARKLFGEKDPIGQSLSFWTDKEAYVTGIIEDLPNNSSLNYSCVLSLHASQYYQSERKKEKWDGNSYHTFIMLKEQGSSKLFEEKMVSLLEKHWVHSDIPSTYYVSPLKELHLRDGINADIGVKGNARQLTIFGLVAILVLVLACINYMNLAIARSVKRAKEVGLRKAIGAEKRQLITQFLSESIFLSLLSLLLALAILDVIMPVFGDMVNRELTLQLMLEMNLLPFLLFLMVAIGIVAGSYPALFMSSLNPIVVLKGNRSNTSGGSRLQKWLIIGQYVVSAVMITVSLIIYLQMKFINQKELGFQKEQILVIEARSRELRDNMQVLKTKFLSNPNIQGVTISSQLPTYIQSSTFLNEDKTGGNIYRLYTDEHFLDVYEIELVSGRFLADDDEAKKNFVLNETAAAALGWTTDSAIGQEYVNEGGERKTVIGVVKDFHMHSMHFPIGPLMIGRRDNSRFLSVKVGTQNLQETIAFLDEAISEYSTYPFNYQFVDDHFDELYRQEQHQGEIIGFLTVLAILIASLGLFGLAAFNASQRIKEIGIRKVLGASMTDIVIFFSKSFLHLVVIALIIAIPISWYLANIWLDDFAYRIDVKWWMFVLAGAGALVLALLTISSQSIKASLTNPVESLKDE